MSSPWPTWDPLGRATRLDHKATVFPLGFELRVETNDERIIDAAKTSWPGPDRRRGFEPLRLRVFVSTGAACVEPPTYRADGDRLVLFGDRGHGALADLGAGRISCWVASETSVDRLRPWFLDGLVLEALSYQALTPIHASAVVRDGRATLLCGPRGAGKSTLAAVCVEAGWSLLGDDGAYLLRGTDRVLGRGGPLRLDRHSVRLLGGDEAAVRPDACGEEVAEVVPGRAVDEATLGRIVFLERRNEGPAAAWAPIEPDDALNRLVAELPLSADAVTAAQVESLAPPARVAGRLRFHDPRAAEKLLRSGGGSR